MPNWCENRVTISSNTEDDSQFQKLVAKFQVERPFNEIYPMPDFKTIPNKDGELPKKEEIKNDLKDVSKEGIKKEEIRNDLTDEPKEEVKKEVE